MKRILLLISLVAVIPICGYLVGVYVEYDYQKQWSNFVAKEFGNKGLEAMASDQFTLQRFCEQPEAANEAACQTYRNVILLQSVSVVAVVTGLALLLAIFLAARFSVASRALMVIVFSPGIKVVLVVLFGLILIQGAIATYGAYIFETTIIHRVHFVFIGGIGIGALAGAFAMIKAGLTISRRASTSVIGKAVSTSDEPHLWNFVRELATSLGATQPKNIVIGLEPNFYVTSAEVVVYPGAAKQTDETLYLSLPLMRILSREEITAIIGHELGHF
ncbi:MAG: M48 family metallopeptidase, partial [Nitrospinota bacterium]